MTKNLKVDIMSISSIKQLERELKQYRDSLKHKAEILAKTLAEKGVDIARVQVADLKAIFTGELISSIHTEYKGLTKAGAIFAIVADSEHAVFVEFGTGQKGKDTPYPHPLPEGVEWEYGDGETVRKNPVTGAYYWFYPGQDGKYHYTEGMPSRPFMYNTSMELYAMIAQTAKEIFG